MLPKQVTRYEHLMKEGLTKAQIAGLYAALKVFPTPFKGIYYTPMAEERKGNFIEKPLKVLFKAIRLFLKTDRFYFSCATADEQAGRSWTPSNEIHVVNEKLSRRIELKKRINANMKKKSYRAVKVARLLSYYGNRIIFHRINDFDKAVARETPYGRFAIFSQSKKDKHRFRE